MICVFMHLLVFIHEVISYKRNTWNITVSEDYGPDKWLSHFPLSIHSFLYSVSVLCRSQGRVYRMENSSPLLDTESLWIGQRLLMNVVFLLCWYHPTTKPLCLKLSSAKPEPLQPRDKYRTSTLILCVCECVCVLLLLQQLLKRLMLSKSLCCILRTKKLG